MSLSNLVSHRGGDPENTLEAFNKTWRSGCTLIECDIRLTKDNVIVISHDNSLERTASQNININEINWETLSKISLNSGCKVPKLIDALKLSKKIGQGSKLIIEMKTNERGTGIALSELLNKHQYFAKYVKMVMSFSKEPLCAYKENVKINHEFILVVLITYGTSNANFRQFVKNRF